MINFPDINFHPTFCKSPSKRSNSPINNEDGEDNEDSPPKKQIKVTKLVDSDFNN
jgi:hypothetical protein